MFTTNKPQATNRFNLLASGNGSHPDDESNEPNRSPYKNAVCRTAAPLERMDTKCINAERALLDAKEKKLALQRQLLEAQQAERRAKKAAEAAKSKTANPEDANPQTMPPLQARGLGAARKMAAALERNALSATSYFPAVPKAAPVPQTATAPKAAPVPQTATAPKASPAQHNSLEVVLQLLEAAKTPEAKANVLAAFQAQLMAQPKKRAAAVSDGEKNPKARKVAKEPKEPKTQEIEGLSDVRKKTLDGFAATAAGQNVDQKFLKENPDLSEKDAQMSPARYKDLDAALRSITQYTNSTSRENNKKKLELLQLIHDCKEAEKVLGGAYPFFWDGKDEDGTSIYQQLVEFLLQDAQAQRNLLFNSPGFYLIVKEASDALIKVRSFIWACMKSDSDLKKFCDASGYVPLTTDAATGEPLSLSAQRSQAPYNLSVPYYFNTWLPENPQQLEKLLAKDNGKALAKGEGEGEGEGEGKGKGKGKGRGKGKAKKPLKIEMTDEGLKQRAETFANSFDLDILFGGDDHDNEEEDEDEDDDDDEDKDEEGGKASGDSKYIEIDNIKYRKPTTKKQLIQFLYLLLATKNDEDQAKIVAAILHRLAPSKHNYRVFCTKLAKFKTGFNISNKEILESDFEQLFGRYFVTYASMRKVQKELTRIDEEMVKGSCYSESLYTVFLETKAAIEEKLREAVTAAGEPEDYKNKGDYAQIRDNYAFANYVGNKARALIAAYRNNFALKKEGGTMQLADYSRLRAEDVKALFEANKLVFVGKNCDSNFKKQQTDLLKAFFLSACKIITPPPSMAGSGMVKVKPDPDAPKLNIIDLCDDDQVPPAVPNSIPEALNVEVINMISARVHDIPQSKEVSTGSLAAAVLQEAPAGGKRKDSSSSSSSQPNCKKHRQLTPPATEEDVVMHACKDDKKDEDVVMNDCKDNKKDEDDEILPAIRSDSKTSMSRQNSEQHPDYFRESTPLSPFSLACGMQETEEYMGDPNGESSSAVAGVHTASPKKVGQSSSVQGDNDSTTSGGEDEEEEEGNLTIIQNLGGVSGSGENRRRQKATVGVTRKDPNSGSGGRGGRGGRGASSARGGRGGRTTRSSNRK